MALRLSALPLREQALLTLGCCFLVALAADRLVVSPMLAELGRLDTEYRVNAEALKRIDLVMQLDEPVSEAYAGVRDLIGESGPATETIEQFKATLDELARRTGVSLRAMQHRDPEPQSEFLVTYIIDISEFSGEMVNLIAFFRALQEAPGLLRVSRLRIASDTESSVVTGSMLITKVMTVVQDGIAGR